MSEKNVAIVIAVSEYQNVPKLPACKNDGTLIRDILLETGRFKPENIYYADTETDSRRIKDSLPKFVEGMKKQHASLEEVFFYFSGHGTFDGSDFYLVLTDYDPNKVNQTCLSNTDLDGMLRSLSPTLAVKVIDACESGTSYIKASEEVHKALKRSEGRFNKCYFMYSSEQTQTSGLDDKLSYFTRAFVRSLLAYENKVIRYQDIISYVKDQFLSDSTQKPFFVTQAGHTEIFTEVFPPLVELLTKRASLLSEGNLLVVNAQDHLTMTHSAAGTVAPAAPKLIDLLLKRIKEEEQQYCTEEEAAVMFEEIRKTAEGGEHPDLLRNFFDVEVSLWTHGYDDLPAVSQVARWLEQNKKNYFVTLRYEEVRNEELFGLTTPFGRKTHSVLRGFNTTVANPPFKCMQIKANPRHLNLPMWCCYVALVTSKVEMRCFYAFVKYSDMNWKERRETGTINWKTTGFPLKDTEQGIAFVRATLKEFATTVEKELVEKYKLK